MSRTGSNGKPRVCYLRGSYLNPFETQYLDPLAEQFHVRAAATKSHRFDISGIMLPVDELPCLDYLNGFVPRRILGRSIPNILKTLGHEEILFQLESYLSSFDLVHAPEQTFYFSWQAARLKDRCEFKLILVQDEVFPFWYSRLPWVARRAQFARSQADLFVTRSERARLALICEGINPERIRVVGHGVDTERFRPGPRSLDLCRSLDLSPDRFIILFVGNLVWTKGIFSLAHAAKLLLQDPEIRGLEPLFLIVGEGDEHAALEARLRLLGIEPHFKFAGRQPYDLLPEFHRLADIFVLPSISSRYIIEQFGIVLIESMATGKPVISTFCGAIDEVVDDAGILVQPNDFYRFYQALRRLCLSADTRSELGERALMRVRERFSREVISASLAAAYWEALRQ